MRYEILVAPGAGNQLAALPAHTRSEVRDGIELLDRPQYRLRVGDIRVFYDVSDKEVQVLAIVSKAQAQAWLDEQSTPTPPGRSSQSEG